MTKIVLIGGYPKGYSEPFHIKTKSGRILHKIKDELKITPELFDLWKTEEEENARTLTKATKSKLNRYIRENYKLIALGRYIEKELIDNKFTCEYLPHPASRDAKFLIRLKSGLEKFKKGL
jgi:hypothetical protein